MVVPMKNQQKIEKATDNTYKISILSHTAVFILNYESLDETIRLVRSLNDSIDQGFDIYVIDNNSENLTVSEIKDALPSVNVIKNTENIGYAGGNNIGFELAKALPYEFFWILNPDMQVKPDTLGDFVEAACVHPEYMVFGSTILNGTRPERVMSAGSYCNFETDFDVGNLYSGKTVADLPDAPFEATGTSGCSIFLRKAVLKNIGYLPEQYFLYFEETHWLLDASKAGYPCLILPHIHQMHHQRNRASDLPPVHYFYYFLRAAMLFGRYIGIDDIEDKVGRFQKKFISSWLMRINASNVDMRGFYERLAQEAIADGLAGKTGRIDIKALEARLDPARNLKAVSHEQESQRPATLVVLGMHRSGTSALAGTLSILSDFELRSEIPRTQENPKGFFEAQPISRLNQDILESMDTSWDEFKNIEPDWFFEQSSKDFQNRAKMLVEEVFYNQPTVILKDPRICRIFPFWENLIAREGRRIGIIHIHRNPLEVCESLKARNNIDLEHGQLVWLRYVLDAEYQTRGLPRHFVSFKNLVTDWRRVVDDIEDKLGLHFPNKTQSGGEELDDFLSSDLKHFDKTTSDLENDPSISSWTRDVFSIFERWVELGEDQADFADLDFVRSSLTQGEIGFESVMRNMRSKVAELHKEKAEISQENSIFRENLSNAQLAKDALDLAVRDKDHTLELRRIEYEKLEDSFRAMKADFDSMQLQEYQNAGEMASLREIIERKKQNVAALEKKLVAVEASKIRQDSALFKLEQESEARLRKMQIQISKTTAQLTEAQKMVTATKVRAELAENSVKALTDSTSWRFTAPMRYLIQLIKPS